MRVRKTSRSKRIEAQEQERGQFCPSSSCFVLFACHNRADKARHDSANQIRPTVNCRQKRNKNTASSPSLFYVSFLLFVRRMCYFFVFCLWSLCEPRPPPLPPQTKGAENCSRRPSSSSSDFAFCLLSPRKLKYFEEKGGGVELFNDQKCTVNGVQRSVTQLFIHSALLLVFPVSVRQWSRGWTAYCGVMSSRIDCHYSMINYSFHNNSSSSFRFVGACVRVRVVLVDHEDEEEIEKGEWIIGKQFPSVYL